MRDAKFIFTRVRNLEFEVQKIKKQIKTICNELNIFNITDSGFYSDYLSLVKPTLSKEVNELNAKIEAFEKFLNVESTDLPPEPARIKYNKKKKEAK